MGDRGQKQEEVGTPGVRGRNRSLGRGLFGRVQWEYLDEVGKC